MIIKLHCKIADNVHGVILTSLTGVDRRIRSISRIKLLLSNTARAAGKSKKETLNRNHLPRIGHPTHRLVYRNSFPDSGANQHYAKIAVLDSADYQSATQQV